VEITFSTTIEPVARDLQLLYRPFLKRITV